MSFEKDTFRRKINKKPSGEDPYLVEEEITLTDGEYTAELLHDNIDDDTLAVWTESAQQGTRVFSFTLTAPESEPWKRIIHIESSQEKVYVSYESKGDTVEADDINELQESLERTQVELIEVGNEARGGGSGYTWRTLRDGRS